MAETDNDDLISIIEEETENGVEIPDILPMLPVRDVVIFTDMLLPLFIGRDKSIKAVEESVEQNRFIFLAAQKDPVVENPKEDEIYHVGTVAKVLRMLKLPDGRMKALVQGVCKAQIVEYIKKKSFYRVKIETIEEKLVEDININIEVEALMRNIREQSEKILALRGEMTGDIGIILESIKDPGKLADIVASNLKLKVDDAQVLLELFDPVERLQKVNGFLSKELELSAVQAKIQSDVRDEISKTQRDYYLREQVRAIHKELGERDEKAEELAEYTKKVLKAKLSKEADSEAKRQIKRLSQMHSDSSEASIIRTYLDWLVEMPWSKSSKDVYNIKVAKTQLDKEHFGLEKVKDRILEYLSVRKLNPQMKGPILCFVGPPGVGKTSLGKAIAKAVKRKFVRMSLGGIRDEAEIRGHRRTYIGALPGRVLQGLRQCETNNPVFMMDEIDKIGSDYRGDPSSALLEALDPEQNFEFSDHYLNLNFDLSKVMFILTANITDTIPTALLDRMEIINISGYTYDEKLEIANTYLLPRQIKENGLQKKTVSISASAMTLIINEYTSEAGVRNLERELGSICRKIARKFAEGEKGTVQITKSNIHKYLGIPKYQPEMDQDESQVGLSTGLAWTHAGGEVLYVEASNLPGKGELILTGQLGEVMQESARAAMTFTRSNLKNFGLDENCMEQLDTHIHVPAGAIPKDGPSAGTAMATALISTVTGIPVNKDVAMTGEITLRGRVLPIGGLKEKSLGALRAGIKTVIMPEKNLKDLDEIPENIKRSLKFVPVSHMNEVLSIAFTEDVFKKAKSLEKKKLSGKAERKKAARKKK
ncbi:MAG: endopeptidase La [Proteobacteria bacterium]|nr:endopeptidase La [Pseudomonadota bacterium]